MKRIIHFTTILCLGCRLVMPEPESELHGRRLLYNGKRFSGSKALFSRVISLCVENTPADIIVVRSMRRNKQIYVPVLAVYMQYVPYGQWYELCFFPCSAATSLQPTISHITKPKADSLVIYLSYGNEAVASRSYVYRQGIWHPR